MLNRASHKDGRALDMFWVMRLFKIVNSPADNLVVSFMIGSLLTFEMLGTIEVNNES